MKQNSGASEYRNSTFKMIIRRFRKHKLAVASLYFLSIITILAILAPIIAPYDPNKVSTSFSSPPSLAHWIGTDQIGRDMFSRLLYATRISLFVGFAATVISTIIGVILGLIAGYFGGVIDIIIMRITDTIMSFPYILLVLVAAAIIGPGLWNIILILANKFWCRYIVS